jgi:16S rRNA (cytosine967-C5)-methyltransferase
MKFHSHLNTAIKLLDEFDGSIPFAAYIKSFFRENKKSGSSDRKNIARCCYAFFRMGNSLKDVKVEEQIFAGLLCTGNQPDPLLQFFKPDWPQELMTPSATLDEKIKFVHEIYPSFDPLSIFKWIDSLSEGIDVFPFVISHLQQPDVFIRTRPGAQQQVRESLTELKIPFDQKNETAIALKPGVDLEKHFLIDKEIVIQDLNSQAAGNFIREIDSEVKTVWDCCAGSGGKSIQAVDLLPGIELTVSDIRESIVINLKKRFQLAGIRKFTAFTIDLTRPVIQLPSQQFDLVIADVPCSGSGTWGRTPEHLVHFNSTNIERYAAMQKAIAHNVVSCIRPAGYLLYITCSVFSRENENIIRQLVENQPFRIILQEMIKGYHHQADNLFAALLQKS